jgi:hypothetical protein
MSDPSANLINEESDHIFLSFCTFVMNLKGKKLSVQNVFVQTLQDEKLKNVAKTMLSLDSDYELVRVFLAFDNSISKSKYVTKFTRSAKYINGRTSKKSRNL